MVVDRPWMGFVIILVVGFCVIGVGLVLYRLWKRQPSSRPLARPYGRLGALAQGYDWTTAAGAALRDEDEESRLREEDLQVLSKINH